MKRWKLLLPNALTVFRLLLILPMVLFFAFSLQHNRISLRLAALFCFLLAGLTDLLDGYLARRWNVITNFGKVIDPLADKLMLLTVIICLCISKDIPLLALSLTMAKELIMVLGGVILYKKGVIIPANSIGKIGTALFTFSVTLSFFGPYISPLHKILFYITVAFAYFSMVQYGYVVYRQWLQKGKADR